jgi:hypothetical protein
MGKKLPTKGLKPTDGARWFFRSWWLMTATAPAIVIMLVAQAEPHRIAELAKQGLVQPTIAALIAASVVLSMRMTWGRYSNDRRRGNISASSATIAVRLWAICFALLMGSMLIASVVARLPDNMFAGTDSHVKAVETQLEVSTNQSAPIVGRAKVSR